MGAVDEWSPPAAFDEYEIVRPLGAGGMGQVWVARDTLLERAVAIKFIATEPGPEERQRFLVEARAAGRLQHPNVVTVHRVGEIAGRPYLVSELVRGQSLADLPRPVPWRRAFDLAQGLVRGLSAAHRKGVLHRDIKPGNVIIAEDDTVKLVDFGIAKLLGPSSVSLEPISEPVALGAPGQRDAPTAAQPPAPRDDPDTPRTTPQRLGATPAVSAPVALSPAPVLMPIEPIDPHLTAAGVVLGTPRFMAPELWRGEPATPSSDLYALGVLLYDLCADRTPFGALPAREIARVVQREDARALAEVAPDVDVRFAAIVDRCLQRDPEARFRTAEELADALEQIGPLARGDAVPEGNPYRGLEAFDAAHRGLFFGRSGEVRVILDRLRTESFVLVAGDSGVGKSSICRAGVLPFVTEGVLGGSWVVAQLLPGRHPDAALAGAIAEALDTDEDAIARLLTEEPASLGRSLRKLLGPERGLVVFVDQMEELVTLSAPAAAAVAGDALGRLATRSPRIRVLATVRGDFVTRLAAVPGIGYDVGRALYIVRRLGADRIQDVVRGPARATGIRFESDGLVDELVRSATASGEGGLPLLQFALAELWEARDPTARVITAESLRAIGGVEGALARHGDAVLARLPPAEQRAARRVLVGLVTASGTSERRVEAELVAADPAARRALHALVQARLVVAREIAGVATAELAHETLVRGWTTLSSWLHEDEGQRAARLRLEAASAEWERVGRAREELLRDRHLAEAAALPAESLGERSRELVRISLRAERSRRLRRRLLALAVPLGAMLLWGAVRLDAARTVAARVGRRLDQADRALVRARAAQRGAEDERRRALSRFDAGDAEGAEPIWAAALDRDREVERLYGRAGDALEAALLLNGSAPPVRRRLADLLVARILFSERSARGEQVDLWRRLALYDEGGAARRRLRAPARLRVQLDPPGARLRITRIERTADGGRRLSGERDLDGEPNAEVALEPGAWQLSAEAQGHASMIAPLVVSRGQRLVTRLALPRDADVPAGFVVLPAGRFQFGSGDEALRRDFFHTVPRHEIATGSFLIARHETTFAEWLVFLESLPASERERRLPHSGGSGGMEGSLALSREADGRWRITIQPAGRAYTARQGEPLRIAERAHHAELDWSRLPVVGISVDDARAYLAWLRATRRVPGARLCDEREWERAARGADGRSYPHGDRLAPGDANFDRTYDRQQDALGPDEVGSHPASRSPFGVDDMAGNVWEWTASALSRGAPVARGGAFYFDENTSRSDNREEVDPSLRDVSLGLRVCADAPR
jgi:serine/threonine protein kinase/formylglycine-generating enzyme required for sulfatase activity